MSTYNKLLSIVTFSQLLKKSILYLQRLLLLTGLSLGSMKNILMIISNSPHPVSVISSGGLVTTEKEKE